MKLRSLLSVPASLSRAMRTTPSSPLFFLGEKTPQESQSQCTQTSKDLTQPDITGSPAAFDVHGTRAFSNTPFNQDWLHPKRGHTQKNRKGRSRVPTGGSMRGTTVVMGDYGLRMCDHDRRVSASQLSIGAEAIKKRLRGQKYRLYTRVCANIGVYTSGNENRMGKGKGSFDHWASRIAVSKIIFELKGDLHEQVVRDAFRLAGNKMPGQYEFVRKGDPPVMGITKVPEGVTLDMMKRPWIYNKPPTLDGTDSPPSLSAGS